MNRNIALTACLCTAGFACLPVVASTTLLVPYSNSHNGPDMTNATLGYVVCAGQTGWSKDYAQGLYTVTSSAVSIRLVGAGVLRTTGDGQVDVPVRVETSRVVTASVTGGYEPSAYWESLKRAVQGATGSGEPQLTVTTDALLAQPTRGENLTVDSLATLANDVTTNTYILNGTYTPLSAGPGVKSLRLSLVISDNPDSTPVCVPIGSG
jgi:hypothetical protein